MNEYLDNLDNFKKLWQEQQARLNELEETNRELCRRLESSKTSTYQSRLVSSVRRQAFTGLLLPIIAPTICTVLNMPTWYGLLYALFGCIAAIAQFLFGNYIKAKDLVSLPVAEAVQRAIHIKKTSLCIETVIIILATALLVIGAYIIVDHSPHIIIGASIGLVGGLTVGIYRRMKLCRIIKNMIDSIK